MQVICTKPIVNCQEGAEEFDRPEVGDKEVVVGTFVKDGSMYYQLERSKIVGYAVSCFDVIPDADEIEDAEKEAIVPAPCLYGNEHVHPIFQNILNSFISH